VSRFRLTLVAVGWVVGARGAAAQTTAECFPGPNSNEARTMAIFGVPLAFSGSAAPVRVPSGRLHLGLEVSSVPNVDPVTATPTFCRPDKGPEHTDLLFAMPRPRAWLSLPAGFQVEASWAPPIRVADVKANLFGLALSRATALLRHGAVLSVRVHGSFGVIKAPITCNDAALQDATSICYQGTRSDDSFKPNVVGVEAAVGWQLGRSVRPYLGAGYNHLAPRFQVGFTDQFGETDRRRVSVDLDRGAIFAGFAWSATAAVGLNAELYAVPADAITARVVGRIRLGRRSAAEAASASRSPDR
jgi:hypothetical protein